MNFKKPDKLSTRALWTVVVILCMILNLIAPFRTYLMTKDIEPQYMQPSEFLQRLESDEVFIACIVDNQDKINFQLREDISEEMLGLSLTEKDVFKLDKTKWYSTSGYSSDYLTDTLAEHGVIVKRIDFDALNSDSVSSTIRAYTLLYIIGLIILAALPNGGRFKCKYSVSTSDKKFSDVIGQDEVIDDLKQYISILSSVNKFKEMHIKQPNGLLFTGPPGTGKTLIAKALAGEAKLPFIYFNSSSAIELYVGMGAKAVRDCFAKARKMAPCILFIDELDAIGGDRGNKVQRSSEDNQTLLALLQELDGFEELTGILVIGATNCPERLDPALKRAGRFDRQICINPPRTKETREQMLELYTSALPLADDVDLWNIASQLQGMTGADIAAICNEAAILGVTNNNGVIRGADFTVAIDKFMLKGNRAKNKSEIEHDNRIVAYHESGHAVATYLTGGKIARISVHDTTSGVGGYVLQEEDDKALLSKQELFNRLTVLYAGRASEEIAFGEEQITVGAANDIQKATELISTMLLGYGYDSDLGMLDYNQILNAGLADKGDIVKRMQDISADVYKKTLHLLQTNYKKVTALAERLLVTEELTGAEAIKIIESEDLHNE